MAAQRTSANAILVLTVPKEWLFQCQEGKVSVSEAGSCTGNLNLNKLQRLNAKKYASTKTPGQALVEMEKDGVAADQRPPAYSLQNYWPGKRVQKERNNCDCISSLLAFCLLPAASRPCSRRPAIHGLHFGGSSHWLPI